MLYVQSGPSQVTFPLLKNVQINESNSSFIIISIKANPLCAANNTKSHVVLVEPHITQYTVYISDNYILVEMYCNRSIIQKKYSQMIMSWVWYHCLEFWWRG